MSRTGDHSVEMRAKTVLSDHDIAALLSGDQFDMGADLDQLARFVGEVRHTAAESTPRVGPQLAAVFDHGLVSEPVPVARPRGTSRSARPIRRLLIGAAAVVSGLTFVTAGAAAADLLPRAAQDGVAALVERITPLDIPDSHEHPSRPAGDPQPSGRPDVSGVGKDAPPQGDTTGVGTGRVGTAGMGQGSVGGAAPESVSPSSGDAEGRDSSRKGSGDKPSPPTSGANEQAPAAQDHRRDPSLPPPSAPTADDNPGTAHPR